MTLCGEVLKKGLPLNPIKAVVCNDTAEVDPDHVRTLFSLFWCPFKIPAVTQLPPGFLWFTNWKSVVSIGFRKDLYDTFH